MMIFQDWSANSSNVKGRVILIAYRVATLARINRFMFVLLLPISICYRLFIEWFLGVEIPYKTRIGKGCKLYHGHALVINDGTVIGDNCTLRHCTTIGNKQLEGGKYSECPKIGNNVDIGSNVCIIGPILVGHNVKIGAGTVVVKDVPNNVIVVGNPARIISTNENTTNS